MVEPLQTHDIIVLSRPVRKSNGKEKRKGHFLWRTTLTS